MSEYYLNEVEVNNQFENPSSPYYIEGLTKEKRNVASQNEFNFQRWGKDNGNLMLLDDPIFKSMGSVSGGVIETAVRKAYDREKVNTQFQSLLNKYNVRY